jgi:hypothetical protein
MNQSIKEAFARFKQHVEAIIPKKLPSPHKLTFTGAANAEYDGSEDVEVEIPVEKATKIITFFDFTAENDIVIASNDTDDISFGDAVISGRHFFYKTPEGKQLKAKRIYGYVYSPSKVTGTTMQFSAYYKDGDPNVWHFGDYIGANCGIVSLCPATWSIGDGQYHVFEVRSDLLTAGYHTIGNLAWASTFNRFLSHKAIEYQFPYFSGLKLFGWVTFPAGSRFVFKAEVEEDA